MYNIWKCLSNYSFTKYLSTFTPNSLVIINQLLSINYNLHNYVNGLFTLTNVCISTNKLTFAHLHICYFNYLFFLRICISGFEMVVTWQEDTPEEPAQIMASVILL